MAINIGKNSDGDVTYQNPPVNRVLFPNITEYATPEAIEAFVNAWLDDHPEATTTVEDGSILPVKLDSTNSPSDGYVLSYNATAGKFEWYDVGGELDVINSDITDLKQDLNNGAYGIITTQISMATEKTHDGLICYPRIRVVDESFVAVITQNNYINPVDNKVNIQAQLIVPTKYTGSWRAIYKTLKTDEIHELTVENDGFNNMSVGSGNNSYTLQLTSARDKMFVRQGVSYAHYLVRFGIQLLSGADVVRTIYTSQLNFSPSDNDDGFTLDEVVYTNENDVDCLVFGRIVHASFGNYPDNFDKFTSIERIKVKAVGTLMYGVTSESRTISDAHILLPWSLAQNGNDTIEVSLLRGDGKYAVSGGSCVFIKPSTITAQAVSSGDTFMLDGLWYKATTDLAVGDTLVVGTNCLAIDDPVISASGSGIQSATITTVWSGTQVQYDAIVNKDANTLYFIKET